MGTSAKIMVQGSKVSIYKHWDGYPCNVLPILEAFQAKWQASGRGIDPSYKMAQLVMYLGDIRSKEDKESPISCMSGYGLGGLRDFMGCNHAYVILNDGVVMEVDPDAISAKVYG